MHEVTCAGCGVVFEAARRNARWHSPACRKRAQRAGAKPAAEVEVEAERTSGSDPADRHGLVNAVRLELEKANAVDTFDGQLALQLARRLANPDESGVSSLSKELRTVMAAAVGKEPAGGEAQPAAAEPDDEVTRARKARDEARQAAGRA
jgi:hypothetical protein